MNWYKIAKKWKDHIPGGRADKKAPEDYNRESVEKGKKIEFEHTNDPDTAKEITIDHLEEFPKYYDDKIGLPNMEKDLKKEKKLEDTKDARGLYNQQQGYSYNQFATDEVINDWQTANRDELKLMSTFAKQHRFNDMKNYGEELVQKGFNRQLVEKIMTAAMFGVKL